jgi:hypothetical protein
LDFDGAVHRVDDAAELNEAAVASVLDDAASVGDGRVDHVTPVARGEPLDTARALDRHRRNRDHVVTFTAQSTVVNFAAALCTPPAPLNLQPTPQLGLDFVQKLSVRSGKVCGAYVRGIDCSAEEVATRVDGQGAGWELAAAQNDQQI